MLQDTSAIVVYDDSVQTCLSLTWSGILGSCRAEGPLSEKGSMDWTSLEGKDILGLKLTLWVFSGFICSPRLFKTG